MPRPVRVRDSLLEEHPMLLNSRRNLGALVRWPLLEAAGTVEPLGRMHESTGVESDCLRSERGYCLGKQEIEHRRAKVPVAGIRVHVHPFDLNHAGLKAIECPYPRRTSARSRRSRPTRAVDERHQASGWSLTGSIDMSVKPVLTLKLRQRPNADIPLSSRQERSHRRAGWPLGHPCAWVPPWSQHDSPEPHPETMGVCVTYQRLRMRFGQRAPHMHPEHILVSRSADPEARPQAMQPPRSAIASRSQREGQGFEYPIHSTHKTSRPPRPRFTSRKPAHHRPVRCVYRRPSVQFRECQATRRPSDSSRMPWSARGLSR